MRQQLQILTCIAVFGFTPLAQAQESKTDIASFINYVWQNNPNIAEAEERVLAAQSNKKAASKWRYNPEIGFNFEDTDGEKKTKIFGVSQTIDWSGKFISSGKTAEFDLLAEQAKRDNVHQNTALNILSALAFYGTSKDVLGLATQRSNLMERFSKLASKSFKAGDIDQSEYNLAKLALSEALIMQSDAETNLADAGEYLNSSIGFPLDADFDLPKLPKTPPELDNLQAGDEIILQLPHIRAMKNREESAKSTISEANKNRLPDPTISVSGGRDTGADIIGISVSLPLHIFNTYGAELEVAKHEAVAEAKAGQNAYHSAKMRLKSAHRSYKLSRKSWELWQSNGAETLSAQADILNRKFKVGDLSAGDYLVQIKQALDTEVAANELHSKVWQSWFAWLGASGTINQWIQNSGE